MWQEIIAGIIVAAPALHAARKYLPAAWLQQIFYALSRLGLSQEKLARFFNTKSSCAAAEASNQRRFERCSALADYVHNTAGKRS